MEKLKESSDENTSLTLLKITEEEKVKEIVSKEVSNETATEKNVKEETAESNNLIKEEAGAHWNARYYE